MDVSPLTDIGATNAPPSSSVKTGMFVFDGRGGVRRVEEGEDPRVPVKGFLLVAGNSKAPEFKVWLKGEIGQFNADVMSVPSLRARCTVIEDKAMIVLRVVRPGADPDDVGRQLLSLLLEKGRVIIGSELNIPEFLGITQWQQTRHAPVSPADLVARMGLRAADRLEPLIERIGDGLDDVEELLLSDRLRDVRAKLSRHRRNLINMRRMVWPQRDVLNTLEIEDLSFFSARDRARLRESSARSARLGDELQALSERAVLVHEQILDSRAEQLNRSLLFLAALTAIFMPLTLITGFLGMNVQGIPFADRPWAFAGVVGMCLLLMVTAVVWLRHKKWV
jgi:zinc transporter